MNKCSHTFMLILINIATNSINDACAGRDNSDSLYQPGGFWQGLKNRNNFHLLHDIIGRYCQKIY
jgi:hypothetical protein